LIIKSKLRDKNKHGKEKILPKKIVTHNLKIITDKR